MKQKQIVSLDELEKELKLMKKLNTDELQSLRTTLKFKKSALESIFTSKINEVAENSKKVSAKQS